MHPSSMTTPTDAGPTAGEVATLPATTPDGEAAGRSPVRDAGRRSLRALASDVGQGTVEYVGLLLLMATVLAAIVGGAKQLGGNDQIGKKVVTQIGKSIDQAGGAGGK